MQTIIIGKFTRIAIRTSCKKVSALTEVSLLRRETDTGISFDRFIPFMLLLLIDMQKACHTFNDISMIASRVFRMRACGNSEEECLKVVTSSFSK